MSGAQDFLMSGGMPTVTLSNVGDRFDGVTVSVGEPFQGRTLGKDPKPAWWDDAQTQPKMVVPVTLKSDLDGKHYVLHVAQSSDRQKVLAKAIRDAGSSSWEEGSHVSIAVVGKEAIGGGMNDKSLHGAAYTPPPSRGAQMLAAVPGLTPSVPVQDAVPASVLPAAPAVVPQAATAPSALSQVDVSSLPPEVQELMRQLQNK